MPEEKRGRGRPRKNPVVETNEQSSPTSDSSTEFSSYMSRYVSDSVFGLDIFDIYDAKDISNMIKNPMVHNEQLRKLSERLYSSNGLFTQCVDYCTAMPTLDYCVIPTGTQNKKTKNKKTMSEALDMLHHKELIRDILFKDMVDGCAFYYCICTKPVANNTKYMDDYDVENIMEINSDDYNISVVPLPLDFTKIVGRKNSSYVLAFNLRYFDNLDENERKRKLKMYPKEITSGWDTYNKQQSGGKNWIILDNSKTIVSKVRSKMEESWGRPLCLAAIKNILYSSYFQDTCRNTLDENNNRIVYMEFPQGDKPGKCSLTEKQQRDLHTTVKDAVLTKNTRNSTSFFSIATGTKINQIKPDNSLLDEKNSSYIQDQIGIDLGFMSNLLSGSGSGNYAAQQTNLQLLLSEVMMWIEPITAELEKVINLNIIKDSKNKVKIYYFPCSYVTRKDFSAQMKDLYLQGKGSLQFWIASCGINPEAYISLMDEEKAQKFDERFTPHPTSFTISKDSDDKGGRPEKENPTNNSTLTSKANNANDMPSPSDI